MNLSLSGRRAVVTGGGSGIGESISLQLARQGADVVILDLDLDKGQNVVALISHLNGKAEAFRCDVSDTASVDAIFKKLLESEPIDILINNAGIAHIGSIETTSPEDMDRLYEVNVKGVYNAARAVIPSMKSRHHGVIINMASVASSIGIPDRFAYSMSKGAVLTMTYSIATDYVKDGIRCNSIAPARVHTPFVDAFLEKNYPDNLEEMFEILSQSQPIGRMGKANEVASLVGFLCSDEAAFITGSNFPIDGGFVTVKH